MDYKEVIESRYNRQNWQLLLHDIFGNKIKFWNTPSSIPTSSQFAKQALWLGTITLSDNQTISIYEVELSESVDIERNRRGIRDMLLTDWRNNGNAGAFMFCYRKNESVLRFSYVSESWNFADPRLAVCIGFLWVLPSSPSLSTAPLIMARGVRNS